MAQIRHVKSITIASGVDPNKLQPTDWNETHQFTLLEGISIGGNTGGTPSLISSGIAYLEGGNNVTLSQNGDSIIISGASIEPLATNTFGMSNLGNTSGTSGVVTGPALQFLLAGGNNITLSQSIDGSSATLTVSAGASMLTHDSLYHSGNIFPGTDQDLGGAYLQMFMRSATPATPAASNVRVYVANENGKMRLRMVTPDGTDLTHAQDAFIIVRNTSGVEIPTGRAVYVTGSTGQTPNVAPAKSDSDATMPAIGLTVDAISHNGFGRVQIAGIVADLNTNAFNEGDRLYVDAVNAGVLVNAAPAHPALYQRVGIVLNAHPNVGRILVLIGGVRREVDGVISDSFLIGNAQTGAKSLIFRGGADYNLIANPSDTRSAWLPDKSGTVAFADDVVQRYTIGGNTLGQSTLTGTGLFIEAGNNVTLSGNSNSLTIEAAAAGTGGGGGTNTIGMSNLGNTSGTSGVISGSALRYLFAGGNNITLSQSINGSTATLTISAPTQTAEQQSFGISNLGNTSGTSGIISGPQLQMLLAGGNAITLRQSINGSTATVTISAPSQTAEINTLGMSNLGNTSGTSGVIFGTQIRYLFAGGNNVTLSQSINASSATLTISAASQSAEQHTFGMSNLGNTSGTSGVISGPQLRMLFAGGDNVTLSQSINGSTATLTISAASQSAEQQTMGMSNLGNTAGTSGVISGPQVRMLFAGGNNITLSQSINGSSATLTVSGPNAQTGISGIAVAGSTATSGTVLFSNSNNITFGLNAQTVTASYNQSAEQQTLGMSNLGNTAGTSGVVSGPQLRYLFAGGDNVTLSQSINAASATITVSAAAQTAESNTFGVSNLGNTAGTSGVVSAAQVRVLFAGGNNITLSQSTNAASATITVSGPNAQTGISGIGAVGGTATSGTVIFSNSNNVSFGMNAQTVTATATFAQSAESNTLGMSNLGNTSGTSGVISGNQLRLLLAGGNNITLSQSINASSATITISAGAGGGFQGGVSTGGNTAGTTGTVGSQIVFVGGNNVTLSQSVNGASATISIHAPTPGGGAPVPERWIQLPMWKWSMSNITNLTAVNNVPLYFPFRVNGELTVSRLNWEMSRSAGSNLFTVQCGIYSYVNDTRVDLVQSFSGNFSNTITASISGIRRYAIVPQASFTLSPGGYVMGLYFSANATASMNQIVRGGMTVSPQVGAVLEGIEQYNTATSWNIFPFYGRRSTTTASLQASVADSEVVGQFSAASHPIPMWIGLNND